MHADLTRLQEHVAQQAYSAAFTALDRNATFERHPDRTGVFRLVKDFAADVGEVPSEN